MSLNESLILNWTNKRISQQQGRGERESLGTRLTEGKKDMISCRKRSLGRTRESGLIGHFQVSLCLCFKTSPRVKQFLWKRFDLHWWKSTFRGRRFHTNGFARARRLVLTQRQKPTRKWPIVYHLPENNLRNSVWEFSFGKNLFH